MHAPLQEALETLVVDGNDIYLTTVDGGGGMVVSSTVRNLTTPAATTLATYLISLWNFSSFSFQLPSFASVPRFYRCRYNKIELVRHAREFHLTERGPRYA